MEFIRFSFLPAGGCCSVRLVTIADFVPTVELFLPDLEQFSCASRGDNDTICGTIDKDRHTGKNSYSEAPFMPMKHPTTGGHTESNGQLTLGSSRSRPGRARDREPGDAMGQPWDRS